MKQHRANDSELPLAKVGQRQTPIQKARYFTVTGFLHYKTKTQNSEQKQNSALAGKLIDESHEIVCKAFALPLMR